MSRNIISRCVRQNGRKGVGEVDPGRKENTACWHRNAGIAENDEERKGESSA
jgi:hypothetical protein